MQALGACICGCAAYLLCSVLKIQTERVANMRRILLPLAMIVLIASAEAQKQPAPTQVLPQDVARRSVVAQII